MKKGPARRCKARSSRTGKPCQKAPILGAAVCRTHGGAAPQVQAAARRRLLEMVAPALSALGALIEQRRSLHCRFLAARDVLDRAGLAAPTRVELNAGGRLPGLVAMTTERLERLRGLAERFERGEALGPDEQRELRDLTAEAHAEPA